MTAAQVVYAPRPKWLQHVEGPPNRVPERRWEVNEHLAGSARMRAAMTRHEGRAAFEGQDRRCHVVGVGGAEEEGPLYRIPSAMHVPAMAKLHAFA